MQISARLSQITRVISNFSLEEEAEIIRILKGNVGMFAWKSINMPSIDPNTIYHHQTLDLTIKPISRGRAIEDEVEKLLKEGFIQEIKYPTWQTNIITIKKKLGKW